MLYAKVENDEVVAYPYTLSDIRRGNPAVSFPVSPTADDLAPFGALPVARTNAPAGAGQIAEEGEPVFVNGVLTQTWTITDAPPPTSVTPAQAKLALHAAGLLDAAEAAVEAAGVEAKIYWSSALSFERRHPLILSIGAALDLTESQIDDLFRDAATR